MAVSRGTKRIIIALAVAGVFISGAFVFASTGFSFLNTNIVNAASTASLLQAFSQKDSDGDGLPDWQEALYGTDPNNPHSVSPTLTDGQAVSQGLVSPKFTAPTATSTNEDIAASVPGDVPAANTLTAQFAQDFFQNYVTASGGQEMSDSDKNALIAQLMKDFTSRAQAALVSPYTIVNVQTDSSESPNEYLAVLEGILKKHDVPKGAGDPITLMDAFIQNNDTSAGAKLQTLATSYAGIASDLSALSVPPALASDHLALMQSFDSLGRATTVVTNYQADPVATLGAIGIYVPEGTALNTALQNIVSAAIQTGEPAAGQPGAELVTRVRALQTQ